MKLEKWNNNNGQNPVFSSILNDFFRTDISDFLHENTGTIPMVNIKENADDFVIDVAAPGLKKENFSVKIENKVLVITGNAEDNEEEKNAKYSRREFRFTKFLRTFYLPQSADPNKIEAKYIDGILKISVGKKEESKEKPARIIEIS